MKFNNDSRKCPSRVIYLAKYMENTIFVSIYILIFTSCLIFVSDISILLVTILHVFNWAGAFHNIYIIIIYQTVY